MRQREREISGNKEVCTVHRGKKIFVEIEVAVTDQHVRFRRLLSMLGGFLVVGPVVVFVIVTTGLLTGQLTAWSGTFIITAEPIAVVRSEDTGAAVIAAALTGLIAGSVSAVSVTAIIVATGAGATAVAGTGTAYITAARLVSGLVVTFVAMSVTTVGVRGRIIAMHLEMKVSNLDETRLGRK